MNSLSQDLSVDFECIEIELDISDFIIINAKLKLFLGSESEFQIMKLKIKKFIQNNSTKNF